MLQARPTLGVCFLSQPYFVPTERVLPRGPPLIIKLSVERRRAASIKKFCTLHKIPQVFSASDSFIMDFIHQQVGSRLVGGLPEADSEARGSASRLGVASHTRALWALGCCWALASFFNKAPDLWSLKSSAEVPSSLFVSITFPFALSFAAKCFGLFPPVARRCVVHIAMISERLAHDDIQEKVWLGLEFCERRLRLDLVDIFEDVVEADGF